MVEISTIGQVLEILLLIGIVLALRRIVAHIEEDREFALARIQLAERVATAFAAVAAGGVIFAVMALIPLAGSFHPLFDSLGEQADLMIELLIYIGLVVLFLGRLYFFYVVAAVTEKPDGGQTDG